MKKIRLEFYPYVEHQSIGEIQVSLEMSKKEYNKFLKLPKDKQNEIINSNATVKVTDFDVTYEVPELEDISITEI